jgi:hypothetical protein
MHDVRGMLHRVRPGTRPTVPGVEPAATDALSPLDPNGLAAAEEVARKRFDAVLGAGAVDSLLAVCRPGGAPVLGTHRLVRAGHRLGELDADDSARVEMILTGANPALAAYLTLLLAAGRDLGTISRLAESVQAYRRDFRWLHHHLGVLGGNLGAAEFIDDDGARLRLRQQSPGHGGAAAMILMRVLLDPAFALWLTTGIRLEDDRGEDGLPFEQRFRAQQDAVSVAINRKGMGPAPRPRFLGAPPTAMAKFANRFTLLTGARFGWVPLIDADWPRRVAALDAAAAAAGAGLPVPVMVEGSGDRAVLLAIWAPDQSGALRCFDPAAGLVADVARSDLDAGRVGIAGMHRLEGILLPDLTLT